MPATLGWESNSKAGRVTATSHASSGPERRQAEQAPWDTVIHTTTMKKTQECLTTSRREVGGSLGFPEGVTPDCCPVEGCSILTKVNHFARSKENCEWLTRSVSEVRSKERGRAGVSIEERRGTDECLSCSVGFGDLPRTLSVWRLSLLFGPNRVEKRQGSPSLSGRPTEELH